MTEQQKSIIKTLREQNFSYNAIAKAMGVTVATVKSYCQRSGLAGNRCRCCGKQLIQREKVKQRKFCSDECRVTWWNSHPELVKRRNPHTVKCLCCGNEFTYFGIKQHKFCCHECYIKHRFEGVTHDTEAV